MTALVVAHLHDRPHPATGPYLWRRFLRIYPAYWLVVTVVVYVFADKTIGDPKSFVLYYGLVHIYSVQHVLGPLQQSSTLATEVSFYVFLPIFAFAFALRSGSIASVERRLRREVAGFIDRYNHRRRHSSAEMLPPVAYEAVLAERARQGEGSVKTGLSDRSRSHPADPMEPRRGRMRGSNPNQQPSTISGQAQPSGKKFLERSASRGFAPDCAAREIVLFRR